jgi:large subunit ribosomal protein L4
MKVSVFDTYNKEVEQLELPEEIFNVKWNPDLVHQVFVSYMSNLRKPWAHTKTRGEVSGGGKKPWRQKHTGRARHGSIRSPLWKGGGVVFGPRNEKDYSKKINDKMKKLALFSVLSKKLKEEEIKIVKEIDLKEPKTKEAIKILENLELKNTKTLIISKPKNKNLFLSFRNIPKILITTPQTLNIYDALNNKKILFEKEALIQFVGKYKK